MLNSNYMYHLYKRFDINNWRHSIKFFPLGLHIIYINSYTNLHTSVKLSLHFQNFNKISRVPLAPRRVLEFSINIRKSSIELRRWKPFHHLKFRRSQVHDSDTLKGYKFFTVHCNTMVHIEQSIKLFGGQSELSKK